MKKLRIKLFATIFTIITIFTLFIYLYSNIRYYNQEQKNISDVLRIASSNNYDDKKLRIFMEYNVYTIILDNDGSYKAIISHTFNDIDKKAAYVYYLMNNGYYYDLKTIKDDATSSEYAYVAQNLSKLKGVDISTSWKRVYPYGDTLRQILGNVSTSKNGIPNENRALYLNKGYKLNDRVGLSYLELQYEDEMRGSKDYYSIKNGKKKLIKKGQ